MADKLSKTEPENSISPKDLFYHLFAELKGLNDTYTKYVFTTTATQVLIIGWFISEKAPDFKTGVGACVVYGTIIFFMLIEIPISYYIWKLSQTTGQLIKELKFTEEKYYSFKQINGKMVAGMILAHAVLYVVLAVVIYLHQRTPATTHVAYLF